MNTYEKGYARIRHADFPFEAQEAALKDFEAYDRLTLEAKDRLHEEICHAIGAYQIRESYAAEPKSTATADKIDEILKSLRRIASFGREAFGSTTRSPAAETAVHFIAAAADEWAAKQPKHKLPYQFDPVSFNCDGITGMDYGSQRMVANFFETASLIEKFARAAEASLRTRERGEFEMTGIRWLAGSELPQIYEDIFNEHCAASLTPDEGSGSPGIEFVIAILSALGIKSERGGRHSASAIKGHILNARKTEKD